MPLTGRPDARGTAFLRNLWGLCFRANSFLPACRIAPPTPCAFLPRVP